MWRRFQHCQLLDTPWAWQVDLVVNWMEEPHRRIVPGWSVGKGETTC